MPVKYSSKKVIQINENLRVYQYFYSNGVRIYYVPRNDAEETVVVWIPYPLDYIGPCVGGSDAGYE